MAAVKSEESEEEFWIISRYVSDLISAGHFASLICTEVEQVVKDSVRVRVEVAVTGHSG